MMFRLLTLVASTALLTSPAVAQVMALNPTTMIGYAGTVAADSNARDYYAGRGQTARVAAPPPISARAFSRPADPGATSSKSYPAPSAQFRRQQVADYLARAAKSDPRNAEIMRAQFARHDYAPIYDGIARPYGLAGNDAAASLAAYLALGWIIVHDGKEPSRAALQGIRAQAAQALSDPRLSAPDMRAKLGEEFKILFVTVHAGWQSARREGTLDRYAAGVAQLFREKNGIDLQAMQIGPGGFQRG